jgi:hypothetical protein
LSNLAKIKKPSQGYPYVCLCGTDEWRRQAQAVFLVALCTGGVVTSPAVYDDVFLHFVQQVETLPDARFDRVIAVLPIAAPEGGL